MAHRIFDKIAALKERYPHLASMESAVQKEEAQDKLWIAYHYTQHMSWVPNPNDRVDKKAGQQMKLFSPKDGIELNLYFYEGRWMGQAAIQPLIIGTMNIVWFLEGAETPEVAALRRDINRILTDEKMEFESHPRADLFFYHEAWILT